MYEAFFHLPKRPFVAAPLVDRYFPAEVIESSRQTLARCIERAEGAGMLIGPSGTGKTLLLQVLAEQFRPHFSVALLANSHLTTRRALLQAILYELGLPYRGQDEGDLRLTLLDHLAPGERSPHGLLLLIDEAHALPIRLMEEVRMITNVVRDGQPRVRLVLAGGPLLEERLASPKLASLSQRLTARCYLQSLNHSETMSYVRAMSAAVGGSPQELFTDEALEAVHRATDGVPRLINQLCDHALMLAFAGGRRQIDARGIDEAWADLQQLPTPWNERSRHEQLAARSAETEDDVIEIGALSGDGTAPPAGAAARHAAPTPASSAGHSSQPIGKPAPSTIRMECVAEPLTDWEEDFEPLITAAAPEAELFFSNQTDPFAEPFADEEVIFDRYAVADAAVVARNRVSSAEGKMLSTMLEPFLQQAPKPKLALEVAHTPQDVATSPPDEPPSSVAEEPPPDDNIMIIEEDPQTPRPAGLSSGGAHRQEYGQLFASLRRG